jgi:hypothetical protein
MSLGEPVSVLHGKPERAVDEFTKPPFDLEEVQRQKELLAASVGS